MKKGWEKKPLGELSEFQRGLTYAKSDEVESSKNVVLRANNIDLATNRLDFTELKYIRENVQVPAAKIVRPESLLICTASGSKSHLGKVAFIDDDYGYAFGGFMGQLKTGQTLVPKFLFHLMTSEAYKEFITALSDGANINNLKFDDLGKFSVPVPPLAEQRRIVALLDEAFVGIAAAKDRAERNLKHARELFESYLNDVFSRRGEGWRQTTVGEILQLEYGKPLDKMDRKPSGRFPVYGANGVKDRSDKFYHDKPSIIVGRKGSAGEINLTEEKFWPLDVTYFVIFDEKQHDLRFLYYLLTTMDLPSLAKGVKPGINRNEVYSLTTNIPPLTEQHRIVAILDELSFDIQRLESIYHQKLAALDELKKSILHKAFSGELSEA